MKKYGYSLNTVLLTALLVGTRVVPFFAQPSELRFESLKSVVGENASGMARIIQDHQGYLWICYDTEGLFRYDGYSLTRYQYRPFDPYSLSQNIIYTFFIDKRDTIWLGTPEGLCRFDRNTGTFDRLNPLYSPSVPDLGNVSSIAEDDQGALWIGNFEGHLWRYDRGSNRFKELTKDLPYASLPGQSNEFHEGIIHLLKTGDGHMWIASTAGLFRTRTVSGKLEDPLAFIPFLDLSETSASAVAKNVFFLYEDRQKMIWLMVEPDGLYRLDPVARDFKHFNADPDVPGSISSNGHVSSISQIVEDDDQNLWIATRNGLNRLNKERTAFKTWYENPSDPYGLQSGVISTLGFEKGGNLLIMTPKGLQQAHLKPKNFKLLLYQPEKLNTIIRNEITAVTEDPGGQIWIGTWGRGMKLWDNEKGIIRSWQHKPNDPLGLRSNVIAAIIRDKNHKVWVCNGEYISQFNLQTGRFIHYNTNEKGISVPDAINIFSASMDKDGIIWLGTGNGIRKFDPSTGNMEYIYHDKNIPGGLSDYTALAIFCDSRDYVWVGTGSISFNRYDKKTGQFKHYRNDARDSSSISANIIEVIFEDSRGRLWIGTAGGGLCEYLYERDCFRTHSLDERIPWTSVYSIQEDDSGSLWLGTDHGLSQYEVDKGKFIHYDQKDGLQSDFFASTDRPRGSSLRASDGTLYFGGNNGLTYFKPEEIRPNLYQPPIVITQFKIFDKVQPGWEEKKEITLKHHQNFFSFEFAALNYTNSSRNEYAYRLHGFDPDWIYSGSRRYAGYTNLDPGEYFFKVKASNNDGIWNETGHTVRLTILPPWWRSTWAYGFYTLLLIFAIRRIHLYQKNRVIQAEREKTRQRELEQAKEIEKAYMELKATQSQLIQSEKMASLGELTAGIAHEIQNPLNFINNFAEINQELITELEEGNNLKETQMGVPAADHLLKAIRENEKKILQHGKRADAIVKSMLQHSRIKASQKEPTDINALCEQYLNLAYHGMRAKDNNFNAEFRTQLDPHLPRLKVVPEEIGRVLLNLLNNAFYAVSNRAGAELTDYQPLVILSTRRKENSIEIVVQDNGVGIPEGMQEKIFQPFFTTKPAGQGTGLGLSLSYDMVTKGHGGHLSVQSKEGEGSAFTVSLPL